MENSRILPNIPNPQARTNALLNVGGGINGGASGTIANLLNQEIQKINNK